MTTKIDHVNSAYSQLRISGVTVNPTAGHVETGLNRLEDLMADLELNRGVCIDYNFEDEPNANSPSGILRGHNNAINKNLAMALIADFNKVVPPELTLQADSAMSSLVGYVVSRDVRQVQPSGRSPIGSGNRNINRYYRFERPTEKAPNKCSTNKIKVDEINDYVEHFESYLQSETIVSYLIEVSTTLELISDSNDSDHVSYRIKGLKGGARGSYAQVIITITTDSGRVHIRAIDFNVTDEKLV